MKTMKQKEMIQLYAMIAIGAFLFSFGLNIFIVPLGMFSGGVVGIAQIIRSVISNYISLDFDIAGILNFVLNLPLFLLAYRNISRKFFWRTAFCVILEMVFMSAIPIPVHPIIEDVLAACLIGGICCGVGIGTVLRAQGSGGGIDILGFYYSLKKPGFSVGKLSIFINAIIFAICAYLFDVPTAIYSILYTVCMSLVMDKIHYQNINMTVMIFTKNIDVQQQIIKHMRRGVTYWKGAGAYTNNETFILVTAISKYEVPQIKKIIKETDPNAFMIFNEGMSISGNFEKRL